jgi:hypothetical protein
MSREDDLERQLRAFGETLRQQVGEPIDPISRSGRPGIDDRPDRRDGRRWAALVAAAAVVALVVGLLALVQDGDEADAPVATQPTTPSTTSSTTTVQPAQSELSLIDHVVLVDGEAVGESWATGVASTSDELTELWDELGLQGAAPAVDFTDDVVVYFNPAESGSCRFGPLDGVAHDPSTGRLFPVLPYEDPATDVIDGERFCTSDANPHAILVQVARSDLPSADFVVWVDNFDPPAMVLNRVTRVAAGELLAPPPATTEPPETTVDATLAPTADFSTLGVDDVIVRRPDGDVVLHAGALDGEVAEPVLLIDRDDPRPIPDEGGGPNVIDHVAGTYDGMLVYGDCCEPIAGNVFAISEPGAEVDLFSGGTSDRAQRLGFGYGPALEPGGSRMVTNNFAGVVVSDLATGTTVSAPPPVDESAWGPLTASWTSQRRVVVVSRDSDGRILATEHDPATLSELRRVVIDPTPRAPQVGVGVHVLDPIDGAISVVLVEPTGSRIVDIDTSTFEVVSLDRPFTPPSTATVVRYSAARDAWAWIIDDVAYLYTLARGTVEWQRDVADVWFPTVAATAD